MKTNDGIEISHDRPIRGESWSSNICIVNGNLLLYRCTWFHYYDTFHCLSPLKWKDYILLCI